MSYAFKACCVCVCSFFLACLARAKLVVLTADIPSTISESSLLTFIEYINFLLHPFFSRYAALYIRGSEGFSVKLRLLVQVLTCAHLKTGFICVFLHWWMKSLITLSQVEHLWSQECSLERRTMMLYARWLQNASQDVLVGP